MKTALHRTLAGTAMMLMIPLSAAPASAGKHALLIGNSIYESKCNVSLITVPGDVGLMHSALLNAGATASVASNQTGIDMSTAVESNVPAPSDSYIVFYEGHGDVPVSGSPQGIDCTRMTPANLLGALGDAADGTLVILDSCASGAYADALNALDDRICTITSTTGSDCRAVGGFTTCFVAGLTGAADANFDGAVTVQEAAGYAIANCGSEGTIPTWDGGCPELMIGMGPVSVNAHSWGSVKALYR